MTIQSLSSSLLVADNIFNVDDDVDSPHRADVVEKAALLVTRWLSVIDRVGLVFLLFSLVPIKKERKKDCWCLVFFSGEQRIGDAAQRQRPGLSAPRNRVLEDAQYATEPAQVTFV